MSFPQIKYFRPSIEGRNRIRIINRTEVRSVSACTHGFRLHLQEVNTHKEQAIEAQAVILCTGFKEESLPQILEPLTPYFIRNDDSSDLVVSHDYRVATRPDIRAKIYLNGLTEQSHGINNATSFSMMALKAQQILDDLPR